jgi:N-acetylmuramoyl-L-alanine amidase
MKPIAKKFVIFAVLFTVSLCCAGTPKAALAQTTQLDMDVVPEVYDTTLYSQALSVVYLEENSSGSRQELSLYTDKELSSDVVISPDEESGVVTYTFPDTYNAVGEWEQSFSDSFVKNITVATVSSDVVVTVSYQSKCILTSLQDEDGIFASFSNASYSLKLKLPEGVSVSDVTDTDYYYKNTFTLKIAGKWKSFYDEYPVLANNSVITSLKVRNSGASTLITVKTSKLQGYRYSQQGNYLLVQIDEPRKIYQNIVVLDAGHGGKDHGARHRGTSEKNINYKIIYTLAKTYFDSPDSTVKAYWSRYDDTFISLSARAAFAKKVGADLFVSLHMNSALRTSANGMEVYYSKDNNKTSSMGLTSQILAKRMHNRLNSDLSIPSRGVKTAGFYVIKHNTVPAILIELGFLSGNKDYSKLTSSTYQKSAAQSIYECIADTFQEYPTDR